MKLSPIVWLVVGLAVALVALSYGFFWHFLPNRQEAQMVRETADAYKAEGNKLPAAKKRCADAEAEVRRIGAEWQAIVAEHTPPADVNMGGIDLAVDRYHLTIDSQRFRDSIQAAVNRQVKTGGVKVIQGPTIPQPPTEPDQIIESYYNYPGFKFPACVFDLGTVTVTGTWDQIKDNVQAWSSMPNYLAVADGLAVNGTAPTLTATYNVTLVAFVRGDKVAPPVGVAGAAEVPAANSTGAGSAGAARGGKKLPVGFSPVSGGRGGA
ncbi:MAG: hypothetical protein KF857_07655 [Fimbriimonadaceae bacterium]|nr:hypothetical protein [Fimbriimonadaceae bacterium]